MQAAICRARWLLALSCLLGASGVQVSDVAKRLHADALVFDAHLHAVNRYFYLGGDMGRSVPDGQFDLPRARRGGVDAMFLSLYISEKYYAQRYETKQALRLIDFAIEQIRRNGGFVEQARNATDVERIAKSGKIAAVLDIEGGFDLDGDLRVLRDLYRLGVRVVQLPAHNWSNRFADSCCAEKKWHGLTEHGREVVREMNRLGIVINISHASDETMEQAIDVSSDPVVATHHGLRSVNDIPRNIRRNISVFRLPMTSGFRLTTGWRWWTGPLNWLGRTPSRWARTSTGALPYHAG